MIRHTVRVGQWWQSNDVRRPGRYVVVTRIVNYVTGRDITESRIAGPDRKKRSVPCAHGLDKVHVEDVLTRRAGVIRRDQFVTGDRGWTLYKEATNAAA